MNGHDVLDRLRDMLEQGRDAYLDPIWRNDVLDADADWATALDGDDLKMRDLLLHEADEARTDREDAWLLLTVAAGQASDIDPIDHLRTLAQDRPERADWYVSLHTAALTHSGLVRSISDDPTDETLERQARQTLSIADRHHLRLRDAVITARKSALALTTLRARAEDPDRDEQ